MNAESTTFVTQNTTQPASAPRKESCTHCKSKAAQAQALTLEAAATPRLALEKQDDCCAAPAGFKRILVAVDGSDQSDFAVDAAARLARQLSPDVVLLNVFWIEYGASPELGVISPEIRGKRIEIGKALLEMTKSEMPDPTRVEKVLREGDPAEEILATARLYNADLIIMGTHGRGRVAEVFMGSVAHAVTRKATCPVLTVSHALHLGAGPDSAEIQGKEEELVTSES